MLKSHCTTKPDKLLPMVQTQSATKPHTDSFYAMMALLCALRLRRVGRTKQKRRGTMRLAFMMLADEAYATSEGKLEIKGGDWDTVFAPSFPARHAKPLTLLARLLLEPKEAADSETKHTAQVEVLRPDGERLFFPFEAEFRIRSFMPISNRPARHTLVFNFGGIIFPVEGTYQFRISVDGTELGRTPVYAVAQEPS